MRTIRTKVYQFSELSKKAQTKAIENCRDINVNYDEWHEPIIEGALIDLEDAGFNKPKIYYSGFSSQGDGACFTCEGIDFNKFLGGKYNQWPLHISATITHNWRYYFATSTTVNLEDNGELPDPLYSEIEKAIEDERERLGNKIYRDLEAYYYELQEDAAVADGIEANEYEFKADGTRF